MEWWGDDVTPPPVAISNTLPGLDGVSRDSRRQRSEVLKDPAENFFGKRRRRGQPDRLNQHGD